MYQQQQHQQAPYPNQGQPPYPNQGQGPYPNQGQAPYPNQGGQFQPPSVQPYSGQQPGYNAPPVQPPLSKVELKISCRYVNIFYSKKSVKVLKVFCVKFVILTMCIFVV